MDLILVIWNYIIIHKNILNILYMNLQIEILEKKHLCINHGGKNITPKISWTSINNAESYALILEDPDAVNGTFIHWYIPYINKNIININSLNNITNKLSNISDINLQNLSNKIKSMKLFYGKNSLNKFEYHGPCAPKDTGIHRYIFHLYALNNIIKINENTVKIDDSMHFEEILNKSDIKIISKDTFTYKYGI
jgi:Raf kinase inhibitor-like YbhB/YbcL family protein